MRIYLNIHHTLNDYREGGLAGITGLTDEELSGVDISLGPNVMVVGPSGCGKTTMCLNLVNYATRAGSKITYVDLDVSQGDLTISGTLNAIVVDSPHLFSRGWGNTPPLSYLFGSNDPVDNDLLYKTQITNLVNALEKRDSLFPKSKKAGWIINTPSWRCEDGYNLLLESISLIPVNVIFVIGYDKLFYDLNQKFEKAVSQNEITILQVPRSSGVRKNFQI